MANSGLARRVVRKTASICGDVCLIGCVVIVLPFWCTAKICIKTVKAIDHSSRQGDRVYLASESTHPLQLPLRRIYNLSSDKITLAAHPETSRLMALPWDVRKLIWEFAIGDSHLQISHAGKEQRLYFEPKHRGRGTYSICKHSSCQSWACFECLVVDRTSTHPEEKSSKKRQWGLKRKQESEYPEMLCCTPAFALLKTCRQIYQECIPIVYGRNLFAFTQFPVVPFWVQSVRKHHVGRVRRLRLSLQFDKPASIKDWASTCFCIATWMKSLEELEVTLTLARTFAHIERNLLDPLKDISGLKRFVLNVSYPGGHMETQEMRQYRRLIIKIVKRPRGEPWERLFLEMLVQEWRRGRALAAE